MRLVQLSCMQHFSCLAGACPDTCCRDWEITLDDAALARYRTMPGTLGEEVRAAIVKEEDGACFQLKGGDCPFLNEDRLCRIQLTYGEEALCSNCSYFPRFYEEYGAVRELHYSLACPEAARRLADTTGPLSLLETEDGEAVTEPNTLDPGLYLGLKKQRTMALTLIQTPSLPLMHRIALLLEQAEQIQKLLDEDNVPALLTMTMPDEAAAVALDETALVQFYLQLEPLRSDWHTMLRLPSHPISSEVPARFLYYHIFRYFLKAVNDNVLYPRVLAGVLGALLLQRLLGAGISPVTALYRYSREIEHNPESMQRLLDLKM